MSTNYNELINFLKSKSDPVAAAGMARFGINAENTLGIQIPVLRDLAKKYRYDHDLALNLWSSGIHEARILASMVDHYKLIDDHQMESWVMDFNTWDICDQVIMNLFEKHPAAYDKALLWCKREDEFVKRAGYVLMARLAVSDKKAPDEIFLSFFPYIFEGASDNRNMVKKAVNWAIRQIGKRNFRLHSEAVILSEGIAKIDSKATRWIASDALRELKNEKIIGRIKK